MRAVQREPRRKVQGVETPPQTENESPMVNRHRKAANELLEQSTADPVTRSTLIGVADRWDEIERTGEGAGQIGQLAPIFLNIAGSIQMKSDDALDRLIAELAT
jgi:hypothetical protein